MKYIIKTNNLDKKYKNFYSVKGANLNIRKKNLWTYWTKWSWEKLLL